VRPPVLFVTNLVPPDRAGAFAALHAREGIELALFGGRSHHATAGVADPGVPHRHVAQRDVLRLAAAGGHRAVVCGTAGRIALPAAWRGARRAGVPFLLWSALWAELGTPAHLAARPLLRRIHRDADAVVAYGPHVAEHARALGAREVHVAPQAVDNAFWGAPADAPGTVPAAPYVVAYAGRPAPGKGLDILLEAWADERVQALDAALVLAGGHGPRPRDAPPGVLSAGHLSARDLRNLFGAAHVLVMPSIATRGFREPWGLVANEAMNQHVAVIATDAVGAARGGLVRHERNGLVVPAGDARELAAAITRLHDEPALRARLADAGRGDVAAFTYDAWAAGFSAALAATAGDHAARRATIRPGDC